MSKELTAEQVRQRCDPTLFKCNSTEELEPIEGIIGQDRALSALKFGLNILKPGFNIYVSGLAGTGRTTAIKSFLEALATKKDTPSDWCYVHNFRDSYCPKVLKLLGGMGQVLQKDMKQTIDNARRSLVQAFASKEYNERRAEITEDYNRKREAAFNAISKKARDKGLLLQTTPAGLVLIPASDGEPMSEEEYQKLSSEAKEELKKKQEELTKELKEQIATLRAEESSVEKQLEDTDREVAGYSVGYLFEELKNKYSQLSQVFDYLKEVEQDIIENFEQFKV